MRFLLRPLTHAYRGLLDSELRSLHVSSVEDYHKSIKKKLQCKTIAKAVMEGIRYGWIKKIQEFRISIV